MRRGHRNCLSASVDIFSAKASPHHHWTGRFAVEVIEVIYNGHSHLHSNLLYNRIFFDINALHINIIKLRLYYILINYVKWKITQIHFFYFSIINIWNKPTSVLVKALLFINNVGWQIMIFYVVRFLPTQCTKQKYQESKHCFHSMSQPNTNYYLLCLHKFSQKTIHNE